MPDHDDDGCAAATLMRAALLTLAIAALLSSVTTSAAAPLSLRGVVWAWHSMTAGDEPRIDIDARERYTIELSPDGSVQVRADCNRGRGRYQVSNGKLAFGPIATTKQGCPEGSVDFRFLQGLARVSGWRIESADLILTLAGSAGAMRFTPLPR